MACCAFAAFLISQIIFGLDWARERMGLVDPERSKSNTVVAWRLDGALAAAPVPFRRNPMALRLRLAALGGGAAFVILAGLTGGFQPARPWQAFTLICTGHGIERLPGLGDAR